jgi:hypothetical protein
MGATPADSPHLLPSTKQMIRDHTSGVSGSTCNYVHDSLQIFWDLGELDAPQVAREAPFWRTRFAKLSRGHDKAPHLQRNVGLREVKLCQLSLAEFRESPPASGYRFVLYRLKVVEIQRDRLAVLIVLNDRLAIAFNRFCRLFQFSLFHFLGFLLPFFLASALFRSLCESSS